RPLGLVLELRRVSARRTLLPSHRVLPNSPSIPWRMFPSLLPWPAYCWLCRRARSSLVPTIRYTQCIRVSPRPAAAGCSASCAVSVRRLRRGHLCRTWFRYLAASARTRTGPSAPARTGSSATRGPAAAPASGLTAPCLRNGVPPHAHPLLVREWALRAHPSSAQVRRDV
ncbi:hypothetical protein B0H10DRAFT_2059611, partial [Mycena sp. CBHHK59/15]